MWKIRFGIVFFLFITLPVIFISLVYAFRGPISPPPLGEGSIGVSSSGALIISTTTIFSSEPKLILQTAGGTDQHILLLPNGLVGIATTTPTYTLDVDGDIHIGEGGSFWGRGTNLTNIPPSGISGGAFGTTNYAFPLALAIGTSTTAGFSGNGLYIEGKVGVGTILPSEKLEVVGQVRGKTGICIENDCRSIWPTSVNGFGTSSQPVFFTSTSTISSASSFLWDNTDSRLGIGVQNPNTSLDIAGNIRSKMLVVGSNGNGTIRTGVFGSNEAYPSSTLDKWIKTVIFNLYCSWGSGSVRIELYPKDPGDPYQVVSVQVRYDSNCNPIESSYKISLTNLSPGSVPIVKDVKVLATKGKFAPETSHSPFTKMAVWLQIGRNWVKDVPIKVYYTGAYNSASAGQIILLSEDHFVTLYDWYYSRIIGYVPSVDFYLTNQSPQMGPVYESGGGASGTFSINNYFGSNLTTRGIGVLKENSGISYNNSHILLHNPGGAQTTEYFTFSGSPKGSLRVDSTGNMILNASAGNFYLGSDLGSENKKNIFVGGLNTLVLTDEGNIGISTGSSDPGGKLEIVSSAQNALRLKKTAGVAGSVDLFPAVGDATQRTGTELCRTVSTYATCLTYWASDGTISSCNDNISNARALCSDLGD